MNFLIETKNEYIHQLEIILKLPIFFTFRELFTRISSTTDKDSVLIEFQKSLKSVTEWDVNYIQSTVSKLNTTINQ